MLEGLILQGSSGESAEVERFYNATFEAVVQNGMDYKIVELDYLMNYYAGEFQTEKADEKFRIADAVVISGILQESRKHDMSYPFVEVPAQEGEWERQIISKVPIFNKLGALLYILLIWCR